MIPRWLSLSASLAALALLALSACAGGQQRPSGKPVVVATIFAYYDAARAIGGDKIDARILIPPLKSPHEYESTLDDKIRAARARLFIINGMGLDDRFTKLVEGDTRLLVISQAIPAAEILKTEEVALGTSAHEEEAPGGKNPHIWLDPAVQMQAAEKIRDALIAFDPSDKDVFDANTATYIASLKALDADFKAAVARFKTRDFIGFHSAYDYLAHRYGLHQVASIEEIPGEGISTEQAMKVIRLIKENHIQYVAKEEAFNEKGADLIVRETGVKLITLQPLETYRSTADTYVSLMRENLESLKTVLGGT